MCRQDGDISRRRRVRNPNKSALPTSLENAEPRSYHGMVVNHTKVQLLTRIPSAWCALFPIHLGARMRARTNSSRCVDEETRNIGEGWGGLAILEKRRFHTEVPAILPYA